MFGHGTAVVACGNESRLVAHVGYVGPRESWCLASQQVDIHRVVHLDRFQMHLKYLFALVKVGQVYMYLAVEAACTQQSRVEHVHTVGGRKDDHTAVGSETVHLGEQGVEGVLLFAVAVHHRVFGTGTAHSVNFVDEDDAGSFLFGLPEQVAHTACPHTHKHLHEVGTAH